MILPRLIKLDAGQFNEGTNASTPHAKTFNKSSSGSPWHVMASKGVIEALR